MAMIDDVAKLMSTFTKDYKATYASVDDKDRPKILFISDSASPHTRLPTATSVRISSVFASSTNTRLARPICGT